MNSKIKIARAEVVVLEDVAFIDPEMADMGNPRGEVYRPFVFVHATTEAGRRFVHEVRFDEVDEPKAEVLAARAEAAAEIDPARWVETYEVYGSAAWEAADAAREAAHQAGPLAGTVRDI